MDSLGEGRGGTSLPVTAIVFIPVIYKKKGDHSGLITFPLGAHNRLLNIPEVVQTFSVRILMYQNSNVHINMWHISIHQYILRIIKPMLAKGLVPLGTS